MGIISKILGLALTVSGALILGYGMGPSAGDLSFVLFIVGLVVMSLGFSLLTAGRKKKEEKPSLPTVTEIRCNGCDFKEIRDYEKGDYILMSVEANCPKCSGKMTIEGVYVVREEPEKDRF
ncbi:MAG: hypothetical protein ACTSPR_06915 [Candidatus Thorarchaeota archaeon]